MTNKTQANESSVEEFIKSLDDQTQQDDCRKLIVLFKQITSENPVMWGNSIIGFGKVNLTYASGRNVDWLLAGLSPRKGKISLYVTFDAKQLTSRFPNLGTYKTGKGCIYIKKLADVNIKELEKLVKTAWQEGYKNPTRKDGKEQAEIIDASH